MLSNSTRRLYLAHKCLLYRTCTFSIALYRVQLWYFKRVPIYYPLKELKKIQRRATVRGLVLAECFSFVFLG